jgi:hypothetical protein
MAWSLIVEQLPDLLTAFADAEAVLWPALRDALYPFGLHPPAAEIDQFRPDEARWRLGYRLWLPYERLAPYERFDCELDLGESVAGRAVVGWIGVARYVGKGASLDDDLYRSPDYEVDSPLAAAAAVRSVAAEMAAQLGRLDLRPYLAGKTAEPGGAADLGRGHPTS